MAVTSPYTPQQAAAIRQAVANAFSGWNTETAGQIDNSINSALLATGLFSPDQITAISAGEQVAEPHGPAFVESDVKGHNYGSFIQSWTSNIFGSLQTAFAATGGSGPSSGGATTATPDPNLAALIGAVTAPPKTPELPVPSLYETPTTGGISPLALLLLAGGGGLAYWWWRKHRHGGSEREHHGES